MRSFFSSDLILSFLFPWYNVCAVEQAAGEVARQCRAGLWRRVCRRTANMSTSEIRGYLRAQAYAHVDAEVDLAIRLGRIRPNLRGRILDAAMEQLIGMVVHDVYCLEPPAGTTTMAA